LKKELNKIYLLNFGPIFEFIQILENYCSFELFLNLTSEFLTPKKIMGRFLLQQAVLWPMQPGSHWTGRAALVRALGRLGRRGWQASLRWVGRARGSAASWECWHCSGT
jgi:hypothetical protein